MREFAKFVDLDDNLAFVEGDELGNSKATYQSKMNQEGSDNPLMNGDIGVNNGFDDAPF